MYPLHLSIFPYQNILIYRIPECTGEDQDLGFHLEDSASGAPSENFCNGTLPSFKVMDKCLEGLCVKVSFSDGTNGTIIAEQIVRDGEALEVYKGYLEGTDKKAVIALEVEEEGLYTIVFNSKKNCGCTSLW